MATYEDPRQPVLVRELRSLISVRRAAFYVAVVGALALYAVMMGDLLTFVVRGWFVEPGIHHFHDLVMFGLIWVGILGLATQLYKPDRRVNAVVASALVMIPLAVIALATDSPIAMMPVVFGVIGLVVVALHPAGRSILEFDRDVVGNRALGGLLAVAVIPFLVYAGDQLITQFTVSDAHTPLVHYGGVATAAGFILAMGVLATVRERDRRFAAWSAGLFAVYVGFASIVYPEQASSPGTTWGSLAILWGLTFVAVAETTLMDEGHPFSLARRWLNKRMAAEKRGG